MLGPARPICAVIESAPSQSGNLNDQIVPRRERFWEVWAEFLPKEDLSTRRRLLNDWRQTPGTRAVRNHDGLKQAERCVEGNAAWFPSQILDDFAWNLVVSRFCMRRSHIPRGLEHKSPHMASDYLRFRICRRGQAVKPPQRILRACFAGLRITARAPSRIEPFVLGADCRRTLDPAGGWYVEAMAPVIRRRRPNSAKVEPARANSLVARKRCLRHPNRQVVFFLVEWGASKAFFCSGGGEPDDGY